MLAAEKARDCRGRPKERLWGVDVAMVSVVLVLIPRRCVCLMGLELSRPEARVTVAGFKA